MVVAWACGANLHQWKCGGEFRGRRSAPAEDQGLIRNFLKLQVLKFHGLCQFRPNKKFKTYIDKLVGVDRLC